jgi:hypothetical protein
VTANAGAYYRAMPIDQLILDLLPEEGTVGGIHWRGVRVKDVLTGLREQAPDDASKKLITSTLVQSRLRSMAAANMVANYPTVGSGGVAIWAKKETSNAA